MTLAMNFVRNNVAALGLEAGDLQGYAVTDVVHSKVTGATHIYLQQRYRGIPVYNAQLHVNVNRDGRIISVNNSFLPGIARAVELVVAAHAAAGGGRARLRSSPARRCRRSRRRCRRRAGCSRSQRVEHAGISRSPINGKLMLLPIRQGEARLVWNFQIHTLDEEHSWDYTVDADDRPGVDALRLGRRRPVPRLPRSPRRVRTIRARCRPRTAASLVVNPANTTASPFGWHDTNGAAGAEFTTTQGNNVQAYTDVDANNSPDAGSSPSGGAALNFDFPLNLTQAPSAYRPAAVTNLFYLNNFIHDVQYQYGFDEAGGNFQVNNYGRGGARQRLRARRGAGRRRHQQRELRHAARRPASAHADVRLDEPEPGPRRRSRRRHRVPRVRPRHFQSPRRRTGERELPDESPAAGRRPVGLVGARAHRRSRRHGRRSARHRHVCARTSRRAAPASARSVTARIRRSTPGRTRASTAWPCRTASARCGRRRRGRCTGSSSTSHGFDPNLYNANGNAGNQRMMLYVDRRPEEHAPAIRRSRKCATASSRRRSTTTAAKTSARCGKRSQRSASARTRSAAAPNSTTPTNGFNIPASCQGGGGTVVFQDDFEASARLADESERHRHRDDRSVGARRSGSDQLQRREAARHDDQRRQRSRHGAPGRRERRRERHRRRRHLDPLAGDHAARHAAR